MTVPYDLSQRANINVKHTTNSDVIVYEDHRTILNVLFLLRKENRDSFPLNIVLFDNHDDACTPSKDALKIISKFNRKEPSLRDFWSFTEFDLKGMDDDWVKAGMELGLIENFFLFNATESSLSFQQDYRTKSYGIKRLYNIGTVWDALAHRGRLYDVVKHAEFGELWSDFGWVYDKESGRFNFQPVRPFVLDFDLDCFSTTVLDKRIAIPKELLNNKFEDEHRPSHHYYFTYQSFVQDLINKSAITTLCFENNFCGGFNQAHEIFKIVDDLFFDGEIGC